LTNVDDGIHEFIFSGHFVSLCLRSLYIYEGEHTKTCPRQSTLKPHPQQRKF
jgi:hypothetical protein